LVLGNLYSNFLHSWPRGILNFLIAKYSDVWLRICTFLRYAFPRILAIIHLQLHALFGELTHTNDHHYTHSHTTLTIDIEYCLNLILIHVLVILLKLIKTCEYVTWRDVWHFDILTYWHIINGTLFTFRSWNCIVGKYNNNVIST